MKNLKIFLTILLINIFAGNLIGADKEMELFNFQTKDQVKAWNIVNDGVMGGISSSRFKATSNQTAIFSGNVSLENNGGFASVRATIPDINLANQSGLIIRIKGDGKDYSFRIRTDSRFDGVSYSLNFASKKQEWIEIKLPFSDFLPVFRGRILNNVKKIAPKEIRQIGILISDKQNGTFELEIDWIKTY
jgi:NADH dehydrogenase [ubiquinone] 1 alpha subcomplex assembly factor 1